MYIDLMNQKEQIAQCFLVRLIISAIALAYFGIALFEVGQSGNSGMAPNVDKFLPVVLIFACGGFLIIKALYHFVKGRPGHALASICAAALIAAVFVLLIYLERG